MAALPEIDRRWLEEHGIAHRTIGHGGQVGVVIERFQLPSGKHDRNDIDLLIILPGDYPDAWPDMFFMLPWIRLAPGRYPDRADQPTSSAASHGNGGRATVVTGARASMGSTP